MLRCHHGIYDGGEVVYVWESLNAQYDIVEGAFSDLRGTLGCLNH